MDVSAMQLQQHDQRGSCLVKVVIMSWWGVFERAR